MSAFGPTESRPCRALAPATRTEPTNLAGSTEPLFGLYRFRVPVPCTPGTNAERVSLNVVPEIRGEPPYRPGIECAPLKPVRANAHEAAASRTVFATAASVRAWTRDPREFKEVGM